MVADTIRSIFVQQRIALSGVELIICDDDSEASARELVLSLAHNAPMPVHYVISGSSNVSICRNACLAAARGDWIAFIDDDEIAESDWLAELLSVQAQFCADVVKGFVRAVYPPDTPRWIRDGDPFTRDAGPTGTPVSNVATGNVLFRHDFAKSRAIEFNPRFGRTGSEDIDFFNRFQDFGARMVSSREAIVNEIVPPSRVTSRSLSRRFQRQGHTYGSAFVPRVFSTVRLAAVGKSIFRVATCAIYPLVRLVSPSRKLGLTLFRSFWFHLGLLEGVVGREPMRFE